MQDNTLNGFAKKLEMRRSWYKLKCAMVEEPGFIEYTIRDASGLRGMDTAVAITAKELLPIMEYAKSQRLYVIIQACSNEQRNAIDLKVTLSDYDTTAKRETPWRD